MNTLLDLIDTSDLIEVDGHSIRYFGLDEDAYDDDDDDPIILHLETVDEDFGSWEWFFTVNELKTAKFNEEKGEWTLSYGEDDYPIAIRIYKLDSRGNNEF